MTASAADLSDLTRYLGLVVAVVGAGMTSPEATLHAWGEFRHWLRQARGAVARFLPFLRRSGVFPASTAHGSASGTVTVTSSARGVVGWGPEASLEDKIDLLDRRTLRMDKEIGQLQIDLRKAEDRLKAHVAEAVDALRGEARDIRRSIEQFRREVVRGDASALPLVVGGLVVTGLAPDAASFQMWAWGLGLLVAVGLAVLQASRITRDYRRRRG